MISGPDLGGGYLHQLSRESGKEVASFTYHAQEGGQDAGGPALGPLDVFGFTHPQSPCQFGGPRCWHRRFELPAEETLRVRVAYNRWRFTLSAALEQRYGGRPVAFDAAIAEIASRVAGPMAAEGIPWFVGGSSAARLQGVPLDPRDIDLGTSPAGVRRIAELVSEYLIEPLGPTEWAGSRRIFGARAFVGTMRDGSRVEWGIPLDPPADPEFGDGTVLPKTVSIRVGGTPVRVTRLEYALVRAAAQGEHARVGPIAWALRTSGPDRELFDTLVAGRRLESKTREELTSLLWAGRTSA